VKLPRTKYARTTAVPVGAGAADAGAEALAGADDGGVDGATGVEADAVAAAEVEAFVAVGLAVGAADAPGVASPDGGATDASAVGFGLDGVPSAPVAGVQADMAIAEQRARARTRVTLERRLARMGRTSMWLPNGSSIRGPHDGPVARR
jgi:hypothetical protein